MRKLRSFVVSALSFLLLSIMLTGCDTFLNFNSPSPSPETSETSPAPDRTVKQYKRGTLSPTSYASDYLDLKFVAPKGYMMKTEEQLKSLTQTPQGTDQTSNTNSERESIKEMQVVSPNMYPTLTLSIEKRQDVTTEEDFLNSLKTRDGSKINSGSSSLEPITTVELAGQSYKQLSFPTPATTTQGRVVMQRSLARKCPDGMVLITVLYTEATKGQMETLMRGFSRFSES